MFSKVPWCYLRFKIAFSKERPYFENLQVVNLYTKHPQVVKQTADIFFPLRNVSKNSISEDILSSFACN